MYSDFLKFKFAFGTLDFEEECAVQHLQLQVVRPPRLLTRLKSEDLLPLCLFPQCFRKQYLGGGYTDWNTSLYVDR